MNLKKKGKRKSSRGYTLVEMTVVVGIFGIIGALVISILFIAFRGTKKADLLVILKQNGNNALSQMTRNIRYARSLDYPTSCIGTVVTDHVTVTSVYDGGQTTYSCGDGKTSITSNSAQLIDINSISLVENSCSFICRQDDVLFPPTINIKFQLQAKSINNLVENNTTSSFQSSVTLRNINP